MSTHSLVGSVAKTFSAKPDYLTKQTTTTQPGNTTRGKYKTQDTTQARNTVEDGKTQGAEKDYLTKETTTTQLGNTTHRKYKIHNTRNTNTKHATTTQHGNTT